MLYAHEIPEVLGRQVDEIEDVRGRYESPNTDIGDQLSDDYWRTIDLSTKPGTLSALEARQLARSINRLNQHYSLTEGLLGDTGFLPAYNSVAEQVNTLNAANPDLAGLELLYASEAAEQSLL